MRRDAAPPRGRVVKRGRSTPRGVSEGAAVAAASVERVIGQQLPRVALSHHTGARIVLVGQSPLIIYAYPGCPRSPEDEYRSPELDMAQHRAFASKQRELRALGLRAVGVSSQAVELQREARVEHLLLSDPDLQFARALGLPTFNADGSDWYHRTLLLVADGCVEHAVYPVPSASGSATHALRWLDVNWERIWRV